MRSPADRSVGTAFTGVLCTAFLLGGCSFLNPITTMEEYAPGDGIRIDLTEDVTAENLMILTEGEGLPGHLLGAIDNNSEHPIVVTVVLGPDGPAVPVDVPANDLVNFTDSQIIIPSVDEPPGATLTSVILSEQSGAYTIYIPVLDGTLPPTTGTSTVTEATAAGRSSRPFLPELRRQVSCARFAAKEPSQLRSL